MKIRTGLTLLLAFGLFRPLVTKADDLFQLYWRGTYYTTNSSGQCSDSHHTGLWTDSADLPEKGAAVTIVINREKRCPGTEVLDRAILNYRKA